MATQNPTDNFGWELPQVGGDSGSWGTKLNAIIGDDATGIDKVLGDVADQAQATEDLLADLTGTWARFHRTSDFNFTNTQTGVVWESGEDPAEMLDAGDASVIVIPETGAYLIVVNARVEASAAAPPWEVVLWIAKNGISNPVRTHVLLTSDSFGFVSFTDILPLEAGDEIQLGVQTGGGLISNAKLTGSSLGNMTSLAIRRLA